MPQGGPSDGTVWQNSGLGVDGNDVSSGLADAALADVRFDLCIFDRKHGQRLIRGQPVALIIAAGIVADVVEITKQEGHGVELGDTGSRDSQILIGGLFIPFQVHQAEPIPEFVHAVRTVWCLPRL